jgi:hypothetical protein
MPELSDYREGEKRRSTVLPAHSVVHLARHDHGLELLEVLGISTPTPMSRGQEAQLDWVVERQAARRPRNVHC